MHASVCMGSARLQLVWKRTHQSLEAILKRIWSGVWSRHRTRVYLHWASLQCAPRDGNLLSNSKLWLSPELSDRWESSKRSTSDDQLHLGPNSLLKPLRVEYLRRSLTSTSRMRSVDGCFISRSTAYDAAQVMLLLVNRLEVQGKQDLKSWQAADALSL